MANIEHLSGITSRFVETNRLNIHLLTAGDSENTPVLFLHGNTCCSTIWEEFMLRFSDRYFCIAPDLRGFGETDDTKIIDATRGMMDWVDDINSLTDAFSLNKFHLIGHSLGGSVCWGMIGAYPEKLLSATLISPGPPQGFGGIKGKKGIPNNDDYSGSGGGIVNNEFTRRINEKDRTTDDPFFSPRNAMNRLFWKEGFRAEREEAFLEAMLSVHTGERGWPGDFVSSDYWPGAAPGNYGPANALSSKYNQNVLQNLLQVENKPPLLWIHGAEDVIVADESYSDPGFQGKLSMIPDWPGEEVYPPQPMKSQVKYTLDQYKENGGTVRTKLIKDCGHSPFIEKPEKTYAGIEQLWK